jgi:hypothetical protein
MIDATIAKKKTEKKFIKQKKRREKDTEKEYKKNIKLITYEIKKEIRKGGNRCVITLNIIYSDTCPRIISYFSNLGFNIELLPKKYPFDITESSLIISWIEE